MAAAEGRIAAPRDLRDVVDAVLKVTRPERVLLFGSGARGEMSDRSDIDILVIDEAPGGTLELKLAVGNALPMGLRWTDVLVLTPAGPRKRVSDWEDEVLAKVLGEVRTLYDRNGGYRVLQSLHSDGQLYVAANHWPRAWHRRAPANPRVQVTRGGETRNYMAVRVLATSTRGSRASIHALSRSFS